MQNKKYILENKFLSKIFEGNFYIPNNFFFGFRRNYLKYVELYTYVIK